MTAKENAPGAMPGALAQSTGAGWGVNQEGDWGLNSTTELQLRNTEMRVPGSIVDRSEIQTDSPLLQVLGFFWAACYGLSAPLSI